MAKLGNIVIYGDLKVTGVVNFSGYDLEYGIANGNIMQAENTPADNDYAKFTATGLEGRSYSEVKTDLSLNNVENTALSTWTGSTTIVTVGTTGS